MARRRLTRSQALDLAPISKTARVSRSPQHQFQIRQRPWGITPFFIAPVLPGETLNFLLMQSRSITEPLSSPLIGMWMEYYFFYVKHRDLVTDAAALENMVLDVNDPFDADLEAADVVETYTAKGTVDWVDRCLKRVVEEWFRDEGEAWDTWKIGSYYPAARVMQETWMQSLVDTATMASETDAALVLQTAGTDPNETVTLTGSAMDELRREYDMLQMQDLVDMSYEDWLLTYGERSAPEASHIPELVRYVRDWKVPSNIVAPDATPRYAISWQMAERADKKRRFKEPGFLFGVSVLRPKAYFGKQHGSALGAFNDAYSWLPAMIADDKGMSLADISHTDLMLPDFTGNYTIDKKDLYLYGDQFFNFAAASVVGAIDLPASAANRRYPDGDDADEYFVTPSTNGYATTDGVVRLSILGRQRDTTP